VVCARRKPRSWLLRTLIRAAGRVATATSTAMGVHADAGVHAGSSVRDSATVGMGAVTSSTQVAPRASELLVSGQSPPVSLILRDPGVRAAIQAFAEKKSLSGYEAERVAMVRRCAAITLAFFGLLVCLLFVVGFVCCRTDAAVCGVSASRSKWAAPWEPHLPPRFVGWRMPYANCSDACFSVYTLTCAPLRRCDASQCEVQHLHDIANLCSFYLPTAATLISFCCRT